MTGATLSQVVCGVCNSYSAHLYERLGSELGGEDGMTMKAQFCADYVAACQGEIVFPTYGGQDYCTKHEGTFTPPAEGEFWSYPYEVFIPGEFTLLYQ